MFKFLKEKFSEWLGKKGEIKNEQKTKEVIEVKENKPEKKELEKEKKYKDCRKKPEELKKDIIEQRSEELKKELEKESVDRVSKSEEVLDKKEVEQEIKTERGFFSFLAKKLTTSELKAEEFDSGFEEFEMILLENNVALGVVDKIKESLKKSLVGKRFEKKVVEKKILESLKNSIDGLLIEPFSVVDKIKEKKDLPFVILFFGINGSGKTTSIAKLAFKLKEAGFEPILAAADTFRAASIEQLEMHAKKIGVEIVKGEYGKDPAAVAFDAISFAKKIRKKVVLIDTAGRMYTKQNLMKEMEKISRISKPDLKIFVGESITGNDAIEQAKIFNDTIGIDGIILSKADVDEKAGTILSVSYVTGKPILFLGVGQEYKDLEEFNKKNIFARLGLNE